MPARDVTNDADRIIHIVGTYGLGLPAPTLASIRQQVFDFARLDEHLLVEERAAMCLARHLYPAVVAQLRGKTTPSARDDMVAVWSTFAQQAMYRSDLGLVNMALFDDKILPLVDEVKRLIEERAAGPAPSPAVRERCALGEPR